MALRRVILVLDGEPEGVPHINTPSSGQDIEKGAPLPRDKVSPLPLVDPLPEFYGVKVDSQLLELCRNLSPAPKGIDQPRVRKPVKRRFHTRIIRRFIGLVNTSYSTGDRKTESSQNSDMPKDTRNQYDIDCGMRLRIARTAAGHGVLREFAKLTIDFLGVDTVKSAENKLSKYETGENQVPVEYVREMMTLIGVSMDFVYRGDISMIPEIALRNRIAAAVMEAKRQGLISSS